MKRLFIFGLLLKLLLIFTALHSDLIYTYEVPSHFFKNLNNLGTYYGPLSYITFALLSPLYFLSSYIGYWILKIPYLLIDIFILYLLLKLSKKAIQKKILIFWWLNPIVIFSTYALGQLEIILSLCAVLSIYSVKKSNTLSILSLGAGVAYKSMTLPLLIPSTLILVNGFIKRIKLLLIGLSIPVLLGLVFLLPTNSKVTNNYFPSGIIFFPKPSYSPDAIWEYLALTVGILGFLCTQLLLLKYKKGIASLIDVLFVSTAFIIVALPIYSVHRYMVLMPLLILYTLKNKKTKILALIIILLTLGYIYVWRLQWGLFVNFFPKVKDFSALREWASPIVNYENVAFIFRIIADLLILYLAAVALRKSFTRIGLSKRVDEKIV